MQDDLYQMYLAEIEEIPPCTAEENAKLSKELAAGSAQAGKRLVEGNLKAALTYVTEYENRGVGRSDLVQEANMALVMAVEHYGMLMKSMAEKNMSAKENTLAGAFEAYLEEKVRAALEEAVNAQSKEEKAEEEVLARVNVLKDISQSMAQELDREATVEELAERMRMTEDEIRDIMKLTLDAMSVTEGYEE